MSIKRRIVQWIADLLNVPYNPVTEIHELRDDPSTAYIWVAPNVDKRRLQEMSRLLRDEFVERNRREPQSLHFVVNDIDDIKEFSKEEVKEMIAPWLRNRQ